MYYALLLFVLRRYDMYDNEFSLLKETVLNNRTMNTGNELICIYIYDVNSFFSFFLIVMLQL